MTSPDAIEVDQAVILMAGSGSRLRVANSNWLKPLTPIHGKPLVSYTIDALVAAGVTKIIGIVGFESAALMAGVRPLVPSSVEIRFIENIEWKKQNGVSLLAAASVVTGPFLLTMSDHLFEPRIIPLLLRDADLTKVNVAIDRKLSTIYDLDDAMKLETRGQQINAIGKSLSVFDAIDTGLFVCSPDIFDYLRRARRNDDCSLADGIRLMAADGKVRAIDIGDAWWQDVDTPEMLAEAENKTKLWQHRPDLARAAHGTPLQHK